MLLSSPLKIILDPASKFVGPEWPSMTSIGFQLMGEQEKKTEAHKSDSIISPKVACFPAKKNISNEFDTVVNLSCL